MTDEQEARAYLGLSEDSAVHPAIVESIVYPATMPPALAELANEKNLTRHDRHEVQVFASFLQGVGRAMRRRTE